MKIGRLLTNLKEAGAQLLAIRSFAKHFIYIAVERVPVDMRNEFPQWIEEATRLTMNEGFPAETFGPDVGEFLAKALRKNHVTYTPAPAPLLSEERYLTLFHQFTFNFALACIMDLDMDDEQYQGVLKKAHNAVRGNEKERKFIAMEFLRLVLSQLPEDQVRKTLQAMENDEKKKKKGE
jgi:hypothetical protein